MSVPNVDDLLQKKASVAAAAVNALNSPQQSAASDSSAAASFKDVVPIFNIASVRAVAPALVVLSTIAVIYVSFLILVIPAVKYLRHKVRRRCFDGEFARHPSYSLKSPVKILRAIALMAVTVTVQVTLSAIAEGGVSPTHLGVFSFGLTSSLMFMLFFMYAADFSTSLLINMCQLVGCVVNFSHINPKISASMPFPPFLMEGIAFLLLAQVLYWTIVLFKLWLLNDLALAIDQVERIGGFRMPPLLKNRLFGLAGKAARRQNGSGGSGPSIGGASGTVGGGGGGSQQQLVTSTNKAVFARKR